MQSELSTVQPVSLVIPATGVAFDRLLTRNWVLTVLRMTVCGWPCWCMNQLRAPVLDRDGPRYTYMNETRNETNRWPRYPWRGPARASLTFRFRGGESDQAFRLCPQMKYAIGRTLAELASAAAAVDTWLGVEHINRLGGQPIRGLEDFIEVPFQEAAVWPVGRRSGSSMTSPARA